MVWQFFAILYLKFMHLAPHVKQLYGIFFLGLLIRLFLMPWALQADLISMSYRAYLMSENGFFSLNAGQLLSHFIYTLNFHFIDFFNQIFHLFNLNPGYFYPETFGTVSKSYTSSVGDWLNFVAQPQINSFIFFLKIPHLLADIAIFYLLARFLAKEKQRLLVLTVWWFNPVNLYAAYIFSRHDTFTLLALLLTLIFLAKNKIFASLLSWLAAYHIRFQPLLYLPIVCLHLFKNTNFLRGKIIKKFLIAGVMFTLIYLLIKNPTDSLLILVQRPFALASSVGEASTIIKLAIFTIIYGFLNLLYLFVRKSTSPKEAFLQLNAVLYLTMACYFLINDFSPHYFVWLSLFASVSTLIDRKFLYAYLLSIIGWTIMGAVDPGNFAINQNLFLPVSPVIFNTPQLAYLISNQKLWFSLGRLILDAGLIYSGYLALKYLLERTVKFSDWKKIFKVGAIVACFFFFSFGGKAEAAKVPVLEKTTDVKILLEKGSIYTNTFISPTDSFGALDLKFDTNRSLQKKQLVFRLKESASTDWFYEHIYDTSDFYNNAFYPFGFPIIQDALNIEFTYEVELLDQGDLHFYIYQDTYVLSKDGSMGEILQIIKKDLSIKWLNQKPFFIFWLSLLGLNLLTLLLVFFSPQKKTSLL